MQLGQERVGGALPGVSAHSQAEGESGGLCHEFKSNKAKNVTALHCPAFQYTPKQGVSGGRFHLLSKTRVAKDVTVVHVILSNKSRQICILAQVENFLCSEQQHCLCVHKLENGLRFEQVFTPLCALIQTLS